MKIATWNVNSVRTRLPRVVSWLERRQPDVVCLQETKVVDESFPLAEIEALGYHCLLNGQKSYNGVAILSRTEPQDVVRLLPGDELDAEHRMLIAVIEGIRIVNIYAPNGGDVGLPRYAFKLEWYRRLREFLNVSFDPSENLLICGDFNVAPDDRDVWDPQRWRGKILFSEPEKEALRNLVSWGLQDALRLHKSEGGLYTFWDYRAGAFHRGWGLRIDHILVTESLARRCADVEIDRNERKGEKPSDHAPVIATLE
ncbi:MAG: exodeoxyribonuclease III [Blastocatellia bacterium AA13]|nr:MAG: exodeoxyribonuclease III [Blastocatellia bacterium AA13]